MESSQESHKNWAWAVCGLLLLATMLNYMDRQALAVTLPLLKTDYNITESRVGTLEGTFGFSFALGSILFGWLADRFGPRYLYPAVLAGWSVAGIATAMAGQEWLTNALQTPEDLPGTGVYHWLLFCRILLGLCEAGHWPCALLTVRAVLTSKDRTLGNGILQSGASIGAIIVPLYIEVADRAGQSWEFPFWSIGLLGFIWVPAWFLLIGKHELKVPKVDSSEASQKLSPVVSEDPLILLRKIVVLAIIVGTLVVSWQFLRAWLGLFLQDHHGFSKGLTRGLMSGYFIAADVGCLLAGILVARLAAAGWQVHSARKLGYFIFTMLTACGALVPFVKLDWLMVVLLFVAAAGILGLHPFYYALAQEISLKRMGLLTGFLAAFGWIVSSLSQIYLGKQIEETQSYQLGLVIVGLAPMLGLFALLTLWPNQSTKDA